MKEIQLGDTSNSRYDRIADCTSCTSFRIWRAAAIPIGPAGKMIPPLAYLRAPGWWARPN
jgi:hypothetical protein